MNDITIPDLIFYGVALATVATAAYAVFSHNIVRAVFALLGTFFGVAIIYGMLAADFVAVMQLLVYVGGILVLMLFAVMLTSNIETVNRSNRSGSWPIGLLMGGALLVLLVSIAVLTPWRQSSSLTTPEPTTASLGEMLSGNLMLPFIVVGLILLGVVIGGVTLARRHHHIDNKAK
ncbi:MAG: NADH-quinone oxidoreductase subunit J [Deltaproteobacteria bacterium]|nr:NADH-quinone oxidoreductase subunit J [Deltaproteobacteria bacterium]